MKKILIMILALFSLVLVACGKDPVLTFEKNEIEIKLGELYELKPTVENVDNSKVNYTSLNEDVVKVIDSKLFALSTGETVVVASLEEDTEIYTNLTIEVINVEPEKINIEGPKELNVGDKAEYKVTTNFDGAVVTWSSSNPYIADIDQNGKLETKMTGEVIIKVSILDGSYKEGEIVVNVIEETLETLKVSASSEYVEIIKQASAFLETKGYQLEVSSITDYNLANDNLNNDFIDANIFQNKAFLNNYNLENGTNLKSVDDFLFIPYGVYGVNENVKVDNVTTGDKVAVLNDNDSLGRSLLLLEKLGLIDVIYDRGLSTNLEDVDLKGLEIVQVDVSELSDLTSYKLAIVDSNKAKELNVNTNLLIIEDEEAVASSTYGILLVVNNGMEESDKTKALIEALSQKEITDYLTSNFKDYFVLCK